MARSPDPRANHGLSATLPAVLAGVLLLLAGAYWAAGPAVADDTGAAAPPPAASPAPVTRTAVQRAKDAVQQSNAATVKHAGQADAATQTDAAAQPAAGSPVVTPTAESHDPNAASPAKSPDAANASSASAPDATPVAASSSKPATKSKSRKGAKSLVIVSGSSSTAPAQVAAPAKPANVTASNAASGSAADGATQVAQAKTFRKSAPKTGNAVAAPEKAGAGATAELASAEVRTVTRVGVAGSAGSDVKTSPTVNVPKLAPQEERVTYQYNALGRRDPFRALIGGGFVGMDVGGDAPPDVGGLTVVGIVWGARDRFALCEDPRGNSMVLRKGDKVMNGVVDELKRDGVVITLSTDGQTQSVTIPLTQKGEQSQ